MFPLRDENPTELIPLVTLLFIAANVLVWFVVQGAGIDRQFVSSLCVYGTIPAEITGRIPPGTAVPLGPEHVCTSGGLTWATVLTAMFMHGGWGHLIGNMWFLWVFGNNIEDSMGHLRFVVFYLSCGALASAAHIASAPGSAVPTVGASGAISGVMGAYLVLYPSVRVHTMIVLGIFIRIVPVAAWVMLLLWFGYQVLLGSISPTEGGGVAFWAHAGGFVAGVVLIKLFAKPLLTDAKRQGRVLSRDELRGYGPW